METEAAIREYEKAHSIDPSLNAGQEIARIKAMTLAAFKSLKNKVASGEPRADSKRTSWRKC